MDGVKILYRDRRVCVCVKPHGVLSTDEPGGLPGLVREQIGGEIFTVHRLDRVAGGLVVLARSSADAAALSAEIRDGGFKKRYLAAVLGRPERARGELRDLLLRSRAERRTYIVSEPERYAKEAVLSYELLGEAGGMSLLHIALGTGRTHQIRAQLSSRGMPIAGDRKYGGGSAGCPTALWSCAVEFSHPRTGRRMSFAEAPERVFPWDRFSSEFFDGPTLLRGVDVL